LHTTGPGPSGNPRPPDPRLEWRKGYTFERRRPEATKLHEVVRDNISTLYAAVDAGFGGAQLPGFVRLDLERFIHCDLLQRGFAYLKCQGQGCQERHLVAFSCKGRGFCPSCAGRRMCATSLNLLDHVLPAVGLRQFVLTVPFELPALLAYNAAPWPPSPACSSTPSWAGIAVAFVTRVSPLAAAVLSPCYSAVRLICV
jgi:hypothetical protein